MNYTNDKEQIVFLRDADIASNLSGTTISSIQISSNGIPSFDLFKTKYEELSTYDNNLCIYLRDSVNVSVDNISVLLNATLLSVSGISAKVNSICTDISSYIDKLELSVNGLSDYVNTISTELSTELCALELSVASMSATVDAKILKLSTDLSNEISNDCMHYKGNIKISETDHSISATLARTISGMDKSIKLGNIYRFDLDHIMGNYQYEKNDFIVFVELTTPRNASESSFVVIKDYDAEIKRTYNQLSTEINDVSTAICLSVNGLSDYVDTLELSVNGLSGKVNTISTELSTELCACELSVNGLSNYTKDLTLSVNGLSGKVNLICTDISSYIDKLELSVNGLSTYTKDLALSVNDISVFTNDLNTQVLNIKAEIKGGVNYRGHLKDFESHGNNLPLCMIFGYHYNLVDTHDTPRLSASIKLNNGWLYNVSLTGIYNVSDPKPFTLENNDYIIIHAKDESLSCVEISDLTRDNIDIIEAVQDDYVRLAKLQAVSSWLENDYSGRDLRLSAALSNEILKLSTSLSTTVDANILKLSTALSTNIDTLSTNLSTEIKTLSTSLSTTTKLSIEQLCSEIHSNDNELSTISSDLSGLSYHYNKTFTETHLTSGTDISVDVLNITDNENTSNKYTLLFLSGTLVLVQK